MLQNKFKKLRKLLNKDVASFVKYILLHPASLNYNKITNDIPYYLEYFSKMQNIVFEEVVLHKIPMILNSRGKEAENPLNLQYIEIHLASKDMRLNLDCIDWNAKFEDFEDETALHRFIWLYSIVMECICENNKIKLHDSIRKIICSWIDYEARQQNERYTVWQTYTVVERVVNWLIVLGLTTEGDEDNKIIRSLVYQLNYIRDNLEYHGELLTGCHLLNDGRGLYIGGLLLGIDEYAEIGRAIIRTEYNRDFCDQYYFIEGSTHYHFLVMKWFCDLFYISKVCNDWTFSEELRIMLDRILTGGRIFLYKDGTKWNIPKIGDISPDYRPSWIIGTPWVALYLLKGYTFEDAPKSIGYHSFFIDCDTEIKGSVVTDSQIGEPRDWAKIKCGKITLFTHCNYSQYPNNAKGHLHYDSGSIVLYYAGFTVLTDCGRKSYMDENISTVQRGYKGHNSIIIDNRNPDIETRRFYTKDFLEYYLGDAPRVERTSEKVMIDVYGGRRLKNIDKHRQVYVGKDEVKIVDTVSGGGIHKLSLFFHLPSSFKLDIHNTRCIKAVNNYFGINISFSHSADSIDFCTGYSSQEYGNQELINIIKIGKKTELPIELYTTFSFFEV